MASKFKLEKTVYNEPCPNCGRTVKSPPDTNRLEMINRHFGQDYHTLCVKCTFSLGNEAGRDDSSIENSKEQANKTREEDANLIRWFNKLKENEFPIATVHDPKNWEYDIIGVVTGQSVSGTGVIAELGSFFTDTFGKQSGIYNEKIAIGERICKKQLILNAARAGGNAVLGVDIDYAEVGGVKGMLMVCMTGTAVFVSSGQGADISTLKRS